MMGRALAAEFMKLKRSRMLLWTALTGVAYAALDLTMGPYVSSPEGIERISQAGGSFGEAALTGMYDPTWKNYLPMTPQMVAGGLALFVFVMVAAYLFGREYKEGTITQLYTSAVRREHVVFAKIVVLGVWVALLATWFYALHVIDLAIVGMDGFEWSLVLGSYGDTLLVTFMLFLTLPVFAWLTVWGRGYMRPILGSVVLGSFGNGLITSSISPYWPWNMPVHLVGASWMPVPPERGLVVGSWLVLAVLFVASLALTMRRVDRADVVA